VSQNPAKLRGNSFSMAARGLPGIPLSLYLVIALALPPAQAQQQDDCDKAGCPNRKPENAERAWDFLKEGNDQFVRNKRSGGGEDGAKDECRRKCTSGKQQPFAIVLSCSDSRVPVEMLFDQRIGDIFVVRVAGNVASDEAIGSIEYAIAHVKTAKILVVLGHQKCGAVEAAWELQPSHDMIPSILNRIFPAVHDSPNLESAILANIDQTVQMLPIYSPVINGAVKKGLAIRGAYYSFDSGHVELRPVAGPLSRPHPDAQPLR
jgi:carbonic anhydrase